MSPKEIMLATGATSRNAIDIMLFKMAKAGEIERVGRGFYAMPGKAPQPPERTERWKHSMPTRRRKAMMANSQSFCLPEFGT
jgi:hypothetical protein